MPALARSLGPALAVALLALAAEPAPAQTPAASEPPPTEKRVAPDAFRDVHAGLEEATSQDCLGCHAEGPQAIRVHASHPVDLDHDGAAARSKGALRGAAEVRALGVALPEGKVGCLTCHSLSSPWEHRIALPPGAEVRPAVVVGDPSTYGDGETPPALSPLAAGAAVATRPLCAACHVH